MAEISIDLSGVEPMGAPDEFKAIPSGEYKVSIQTAEIKTNKDGEGKRLELGMKILEGEQANRRHWERFHLVNRNPKAVEIAKANLRALTDALGIDPDGLSRTEQLERSIVVVDLLRKKAKEGWGDSDGFENTIRAYKSASTGTEVADDIPF